MRRISANLIVACVVLIAASIGTVLYLGFNVDASTSAIVALAALTLLSVSTTRDLTMVTSTEPPTTRI